MALGEDQKFILASDEAGTGAWAGPFMVCAVLVPAGWCPSVKVDDSKKLSEAARERAFEALIRDPDVIHSLIIVGAETIEHDGMGPAILSAHRRAQENALLRAGNPANVRRIVDGNYIIPGAESMPKADAKILAASAASIIAKVSRDREMRRLDGLYPGYGFANNVGYGTKEHEAALAMHGPCSIHRVTFKPVKMYIQDEPTRMWEFFEGDEPV